ncbi:GNAT family N-acetyltransferase [Kutzneria sp. NPDC052558]|uniref:GNAT family N-acetyltransferase n=1 Tax=Kutzneria sp. NPDC052558 TaxID=3364121 RepID=UPI0037C6BC7B
MGWTVEPVDPDGPVGLGLLREYYTEIVDRYWGEPQPPEIVEQVLVEEPSHDLTPPTGLLLALFQDGELAGCGGFRVFSPDIAELTRVFLRPSLRGRGGAPVLLAELERAAVGLGLTTARLDTRKDLVEARRLYARHGYVEIPAFNDSPYADHWFEKRLV